MRSNRTRGICSSGRVWLIAAACRAVVPTGLRWFESILLHRLEGSPNGMALRWKRRDRKVMSVRLAHLPLEPLGTLASPPRSKRGRPQGPERVRPAFFVGAPLLEAWQKWPIAPDLKPGGRSKGRPARSNRAASFLPVWRNGRRGGLRGRSERVRVRFSPLALCRPGGIGRRAGFRIQSERVRVQVSRPVLPIWRNRQTRRI